MNTAIISVGSNMDPELHIRLAEEIITREQTFQKKSRFVRTKPLGAVKQPDYRNGAFLVSTDLDLTAFEIYLKDVEARLGRPRNGDSWGPRTIDLDVVVWNDRVIDSDFYTREFVRNAALELVPDLLSRYTGKTGPRKRRPVEVT